MRRNSSEKRRLEAGSSDFWWFFWKSSEFSREKQGFGLVWGLHIYRVFEIKLQTRVLDRRMLGT
jgi:hypothetical protein